MGAELITYIVKGPAKLDESKREQAVDLAKDVIAARELVEKDEITEKDRQMFALLAGTFDEDDLLAIAELDAEKVVDSLFETWAEEYRDVNGRYDPDDEGQKIVVAGEMSWGDSPQGGGYQAFDAVAKLGLFEFFGLR